MDPKQMAVLLFMAPKQFQIPLPNRVLPKRPDLILKPLRSTKQESKAREHQGEEFQVFRQNQTSPKKSGNFRNTYVFFKQLTETMGPDTQRDYLYVQPISIGKRVAKKLQLIKAVRKEKEKSAFDILNTTAPPKQKQSCLGDRRSFAIETTQASKQRRSIDFKQPDFFEILQKNRQLAWQVNFSNQLRVAQVKEYSRPLKAFVGKGNNSNLIKSLLRKRWWWQIVDSYSQQVNFVWTQIKIDDFFRTQASSDWKVVDSQTRTISPGQILNDFELSLIRRPIGRKASLIKTQNFIGRGALTQRHNPQRPQRVQNHLRQNYVIGNKKALFYTLMAHADKSKESLSDWIPLTFHVRKGIEDQQYGKFVTAFYKIERQKKSTGSKGPSVWILKPGECTNRGKGITVHHRTQSIKRAVKSKEKHEDGSEKTYIIQKYIERPLLYCRRKFDIRHYILLTSVNGIIKGYWYQNGYIRTSSSFFDLSTDDPLTHLTNDAVQKYAHDYGKFERANKLSYQDFNKYLRKCDAPCDFFKDIIPKLVGIARHIVQGCAKLIDQGRLNCNFELFGLDFMIDQAYKPYLIECNSNPCLELCCPLLAKMIPELIDNVFRLTLDAWFPSPSEWPEGKRLQLKDRENKFSLIFDSRSQSQEQVSAQIFKEVGALDEDDVYQDDGNDLQF